MIFSNLDIFRLVMTVQSYKKILLKICKIQQKVVTLHRKSAKEIAESKHNEMSRWRNW